MAAEIARALRATLGVLLVRKIGAPGNPEFGIGAVVDGAPPTAILNDVLARQVDASEDYLSREIAAQIARIERRRGLYCATLPALAGRLVVVVDDGIATGGTMQAALSGLARHAPAGLVVAVPVAPPGALASLRQQAEVVCLEAAEDFGSVGAFYADFRQVTDAQVASLLRDADG